MYTEVVIDMEVIDMWCWVNKTTGEINVSTGNMGAPRSEVEATKAWSVR
jgi:hypothetical protein